MELSKLIGKEVEHVKYGKGVVKDAFIESEEKRRFIAVFNGMEKTFSYPDAFRTNMRSIPSLTDEITADLAQCDKEKKETLDRKVASLNASRYADRPVERVNLVFRCNYCDGGKKDGRLGFADVCSEENIKYNILERHYPQCAGNSRCAGYLNGECTYADLAPSMPLCYESEMLTQWKAAAGMDLRGERAHQGRNIARARQVEFVMLTTRLPGDNEADRIIFAVFLADEGESEARGEDAAYVRSNDSRWRIELTPDEAKKMKFWNYYQNRRGGPSWGYNLYRYLTNEQAECVIRDIIQLKDSPAEKERARAFLDEFLRRIGQGV